MNMNIHKLLKTSKVLRCIIIHIFSGSKTTFIHTHVHHSSLPVDIIAGKKYTMILIS